MLRSQGAPWSRPHGGCTCATEALRAAYAMWGEGRGDAASARAAATRHGVDRATPAREMRSSEGRVLETADAFLDDKADRLWRTRSAALRELAQKVRDGTDLVLLCAGRIESCHGDLLRKGILAEAAQLEAELTLSTKRNGKSETLQSATVDLTSKGLLVVTWDESNPALKIFSPGTTAGTVRRHMALEASSDDKKKARKAFVDSKYVNVNSVMVSADTQLQDADCVFLDDLAVY